MDLNEQEAPRRAAPARTTVVTNKLTVAYPYTPLEEGFLDEREGRLAEEGVGLRATIGCEKTGLLNLRYKRKETAQEFMRFCHRSLDGALVCAVFIGATFSFIPSTGAHIAVSISAIIGFTIALIVELTVHCSKRAGTAFKYNHAVLRQVSHVIAAVSLAIINSWHLRGEDLRCGVDPTYAIVHGHNATSLVAYQSCVRRVNPYSPGAMIMGLCTLRLEPAIHVFMSVAYWVLHLIGNEFLPETPGVIWQQTPKDLFIRMVVTAAAVVLTNLVGFAKHRSLQRGFEAAMELHYQMRASKRRLAAVDLLMSTMAPSSALANLLEGKKVFDDASAATVLFSDMVQFTHWSSVRSPGEVVAMLSVLVRCFDILAAEMKVSKVKTIGDCYWAATGIPTEMERHAEVMINFAMAMLDFVRKEAKLHPEWDYPAAKSQLLGIPTQGGRRVINFRTGIHSGPVQAGILGSQQISYEIFGETSNQANLVEANGVADHVTVSAQTKRWAQYNDFFPFNFTRLQHHDDPLPLDSRVNLNGGQIDGEASSSDEENDNEDVCSRLYIVSRPGADGGSRRSSLSSQRSTNSSRRKPTESLSLHEPSLRRASRNAEIDEAKAREQRRKYVETHLLSQEDRADQTLSNVSKEELLEEYSKRKYGCCGPDSFADDAIETDYKRFAVLQLNNLRLAGVLCVQFSILMFFTLFLADAATIDISPGPLLLMLAGVFLTTVSGVLAMKRRRDILVGGGEEELEPGKPHVTDFTMLEDFGGTLCLYVGSVAWFLGSTLMNVDSIITNDVKHMMSFMGFIPITQLHWTTFSNSFCVLSWAAFSLANVLTKGYNVQKGIIFTVAGTLWVIFLILLNEKRLRVQFIENKVAKHFAKQQAIAMQAQDALLTSMLPDFVIKPLTAWLASDFDPRKAVVNNHDEVSVAFIRMSPGAVLSPVHAPARPDFESTMPNEQTSCKELKELDGADDGSSDWLFAGHKAIDRVLSLTKVVDKVKTVGDIVIVAGSFRGHSSATAAAAMLSAMVKIHNGFGEWNSGDSSVSIGLHVGPVMAIVLGFSRLAFDVFGDTVNTTSRVMTAPMAKHKICATVEYLSLLPSAPYTLKHAIENQTTPKSSPTSPKVSSAWAGETIDYGPEHELKAKGKENLRVREIRHTT